MLSISFGVSSIGLPYAGFTADYLKLNLALCPLRTNKAHSPFVDVGLTRRDRKLAGRAAFIKRLEPILHRQLNCFRLFNEACGDLGMQPLDHLLSSKPFHPRIKEEFISSLMNQWTNELMHQMRLDRSLVYFPPHIFAF